ncbi:hypothetical protein [Flavobacterium sp. NRK F7]|uniref:hypothetical protein n=1 Tax=Flavobacterium sp. NRK F7 TaxID=2954930 RepID=UPI002091DE3E|nr:hypothetical protein [Flavobacterium sp. NRK F7]MCO6162897.1 hypothetical protein [Flavobacterium sp. NRK F7]
MKIKISLLLFILFLLQSCNEGVIYRNFDSNFENNRWSSNASRTFSFALEKEENANLVLHFGHIYDFQFDSIPLEINITYPDGNKETISLDLKIKNEKGEDMADCSGDVCDLYYNLKNNFHFEKGTYEVVITNKFNAAYLPNILGVGIQVTK